MAPGDLKTYNEATECWICKGPFLKSAPEVVQKLEEAKHNLLEIKEWETYMEKEHPKKKEAQKEYSKALSGINRKVKDHDHISGKFRGPAHDVCNKKLQIGSFEMKMPLICHNFCGYDSHPLMKVVSKFTADKLNCIPENIGKYKAMDGVFPYDWTNAWEKFDRISLPPRKGFYSLLSQKNISKEDYEHAQKVWQEFEMKNFGEYHDLYLETDVLLLANVFMNYTIMCLQDDGLDPSHYVSAPGMFNDSLYKSSGAELKLMTNMDEYLTVEKGIREGMTMSSHRYAKANNPQCLDYESSKPNSWIMYEDMNALYSGAMTQYMPTEILGKVDPKEVPDIQSIAPDADIGYTLEVDLEVPVHLHDYFTDYPLAPEKQIVPENWLSPYNAKLVQDKEVGGGKYVTGEKLVQPLYPKKNYVIHYRAF
ncbi:hypothetical protein RhiirA1_480347 [Rhizophagus irregularis]|uniref:DNA-directed DNA polymerase n=1 Tax=Rhizophagus irregularis TaxID=588596 RepID=A0A2N0QPF6_9GLOM|nr:hypothetical protein RhiirA1_480347 [Rhizophagus irregularis]